MYGRTRGTLIVFLLIAAGAAVFVWRGTGDGLKSYKNSVYGYAVSYPSRFDAKEYADDDAVFGIVSGDAVDPRAEARVITAEMQPGQNPTDAIAEQLENLCAQDGPAGSFSCTGILSVEPFTTQRGLAGDVLTLKGELKTAASSTDVAAKGPYYTLSLSRNGAITKVLVIAPPAAQDAAQADANLLQSIAESITVSDK